jgi:hypothetical protein
MFLYPALSLNQCVLQTCNYPLTCLHTWLKFESTEAQDDIETVMMMSGMRLIGTWRTEIFLRTPAENPSTAKEEVLTALPYVHHWQSQLGVREAPPLDLAQPIISYRKGEKKNQKGPTQLSIAPC